MPEEEWKKSQESEARAREFMEQLRERGKKLNEDVSALHKEIMGDV